MAAAIECLNGRGMLATDIEGLGRFVKFDRTNSTATFFVENHPAGYLLI
jgi:hypothetical protein